jgi:hypothetical protein
MFNELATKIFEQNKAVGWWDDMDRCFYQTLQLVSTEIAEATEGERKNLMDDKLPHRRMGEVELADVVIRLLDMAGRYGWSYSPAGFYPRTFSKPKAIGGQHFFLTFLTSMIGAFHAEGLCVYHAYSRLLDTILEVGKRAGYDVMAALHEKLEYNRTRLDHQRAHRATENGKKF